MQVHTNFFRSCFQHLWVLSWSYSRTPDERPPSPTTTFRLTDSAFCLNTNLSRATIPLIRPHQCDSEGGRIRGFYCTTNCPNIICSFPDPQPLNSVLILIARCRYHTYVDEYLFRVLILVARCRYHNTRDHNDRPKILAIYIHI